MRLSLTVAEICQPTVSFTDMSLGVWRILGSILALQASCLKRTRHGHRTAAPRHLRGDPLKAMTHDKIDGAGAARVVRTFWRTLVASRE
jgi:hypothetical protein